MTQGQAYPVKLFESKTRSRVVLYEKYYEGYGSGEYNLAGLSIENLQELANWMIGLPPELYTHVEEYSRFLEGFLAKELDKRGGRVS